MLWRAAYPVDRSYYQNKYQGRRLVWQPMLGQCIVKVDFPKGRKELAVSQLQVLLYHVCGSLYV